MLVNVLNIKEKNQLSSEFNAPFKKERAYNK